MSGMTSVGSGNSGTLPNYSSSGENAETTAAQKPQLLASGSSVKNIDISTDDLVRAGFKKNNVTEPNDWFNGNNRDVFIKTKALFKSQFYEGRPVYVDGGKLEETVTISNTQADGARFIDTLESMPTLHNGLGWGSETPPDIQAMVKYVVNKGVGPEFIKGALARSQQLAAQKAQSAKGTEGLQVMNAITTVLLAFAPLGAKGVTGNRTLASRPVQVETPNRTILPETTRLPGKSNITPFERRGNGNGNGSGSSGERSTGRGGSYGSGGKPSGSGGKPSGGSGTAVLTMPELVSAAERTKIVAGLERAYKQGGPVVAQTNTGPVSITLQPGGKTALVARGSGQAPLLLPVVRQSDGNWQIGAPANISTQAGDGKTPAPKAPRVLSNADIAAAKPHSALVKDIAWLAGRPDLNYMTKGGEYSLPLPSGVTARMHTLGDGLVRATLNYTQPVSYTFKVKSDGTNANANTAVDTQQLPANIAKLVKPTAAVPKPVVKTPAKQPVQPVPAVAKVPVLADTQKPVLPVSKLPIVKPASRFGQPVNTTLPAQTQALTNADLKNISSTTPIVRDLAALASAPNLKQRAQSSNALPGGATVAGLSDLGGNIVKVTLQYPTGLMSYNFAVKPNGKVDAAQLPDNISAMAKPQLKLKTRPLKVGKPVVIPTDVQTKPTPNKTLPDTTPQPPLVTRPGGVKTPLVKVPAKLSPLPQLQPAPTPGGDKLPPLKPAGTPAGTGQALGKLQRTLAEIPKEQMELLKKANIHDPVKDLEMGRRAAAVASGQMTRDEALSSYTGADRAKMEAMLGNGMFTSSRGRGNGSYPTSYVRQLWDEVDKHGTTNLTESDVRSVRGITESALKNDDLTAEDKTRFANGLKALTKAQSAYHDGREKLKQILPQIAPLITPETAKNMAPAELDVLQTALNKALKSSDPTTGTNPLTPERKAQYTKALKAIREELKLPKEAVYKVIKERFDSQLGDLSDERKNIFAIFLTEVLPATARESETNLSKALDRLSPMTVKSAINEARRGRYNVPDSSRLANLTGYYQDRPGLMKPDGSAYSTAETIQLLETIYNIGVSNMSTADLRRALNIVEASQKNTDFTPDQQKELIEGMDFLNTVYIWQLNNREEYKAYLPSTAYPYPTVPQPITSTTPSYPAGGVASTVSNPATRPIQSISQPPTIPYVAYDDEETQASVVNQNAVRAAIKIHFADQTVGLTPHQKDMFAALVSLKLPSTASQSQADLGKAIKAISPQTMADALKTAKRVTDNTATTPISTTPYPAKDATIPTITSTNLGADAQLNVTQNTDATRARNSQTVQEIFDGTNISVVSVDYKGVETRHNPDAPACGGKGNITFGEVGQLIGGLKDSRVEITPYAELDDGVHEIQVTVHNHNFTSYDFLVRSSAQGVREIDIMLMAKSPDAPSIGIGSLARLRMMQAAEQLGVSTINSLITRTDGVADNYAPLPFMNGYYVWPQLGANGRVNYQKIVDKYAADFAKPENQALVRQLGFDKQPLTKDTKVLDLISDSNGRVIPEALKLWEKNGDTVDAAFNLRDRTSKSYKVYQDALHQMGMPALKYNTTSGSTQGITSVASPYPSNTIQPTLSSYNDGTDIPTQTTEMQVRNRRTVREQFDGQNINVVLANNWGGYGPKDPDRPIVGGQGNITPREISKLIGGLNDSRIEVQDNGITSDGMHNLQVTVNNANFSEILFSVNTRSDGLRELYLHGTAKKGNVPQIGSLLRLRMLQAAEKMGFKTVDLKIGRLDPDQAAAQNKTSMSGYRVWPQLGADGKIAQEEIAEKYRQSFAQPQYQALAKKLGFDTKPVTINTHILDLISDKDGNIIPEALALWKAHGDTTVASYNLVDHNSRSYKVYKKALETMGLATPATNPPRSNQGTPSVPGISSVSNPYPTSINRGSGAVNSATPKRGNPEFGQSDTVNTPSLGDAVQSHNARQKFNAIMAEHGTLSASNVNELWHAVGQFGIDTLSETELLSLSRVTANAFRNSTKTKTDQTAAGQRQQSILNALQIIKAKGDVAASVPASQPVAAMPTTDKTGAEAATDIVRRDGNAPEQHAITNALSPMVRDKLYPVDTVRSVWGKVDSYGVVKLSRRNVTNMISATEAVLASRDLSADDRRRFTSGLADLNTEQARQQKIMQLRPTSSALPPVKKSAETGADIRKREGNTFEQNKITRLLKAIVKKQTYSVTEINTVWDEVDAYGVNNLSNPNLNRLIRATSQTLERTNVTAANRTRLETGLAHLTTEYNRQMILLNDTPKNRSE